MILTESLSRQESKESLSSDGSNQEFYQQWVSQVSLIICMKLKHTLNGHFELTGVV